ncbi:MAG: hypothetical protein AB7L90_17500 [Hyphomicrobiaceae bacterium]|uniref:hypothetical protein n=1 Tax=Pseudorhodoplanes sp. TaxID=1934341 RepID=UPI003D0DB75C
MMLRSLSLGVLAIVATLIGHYAAGIVSSPSATEHVPQEHIDIVKLEPISAPVIRGGKVIGYVVARTSVTAPAADVKAHKALLAAYAAEAAFRAIYEEKSFDFSSLRAAEVLELSRRIVDHSNKRMGRATVREAVIESLNFVTQAELRSRHAN